MAFLLLDSPGPAGFGNTAFGRMWQGKAIVWILFLPIALSLSYRFLLHGNQSDLLWLVLLAIAGVGLGNTALYLIPAVVGLFLCLFLGVELSPGKGKNISGSNFGAACWLALPLVYPIGISVCSSSISFQNQSILAALVPDMYPWLQHVDYVVGMRPEHLRNIVLMIAVPLLIVRGKAGLFLFFYLGAVWLFCLNPLLAHRWMENILALNYFRLVYLLQLPLLCAMIAAAVPRLAEWPGNSLKYRMVTGAALLAIILSFFYSYRTLSIVPKNAKLGIGWKSPREYQLIPAND